MNGNGLRDLRAVRRRIGDIDRRIYANDEVIRYARSGTDGGNASDREQRVANYMAENQEFEAEVEDLRFLISFYESNVRPSDSIRTSWPVFWQIVVALFSVFVLFLFALAVVRIS